MGDSIELPQSGGAYYTEVSATNPLPVKILANTAAVGSVTVTSGTVSASLNAGTNQIGTVAPAVVGTAPVVTTNGTTQVPTNIKASQGRVYSTALTNRTAAAVYFKFYNLAVAPTPGTSTTLFTVMVAAGDSKILEFGPIGMPFSVGISVAIGLGIVDTETGIPTGVAGATATAVVNYI